MTFRECIIIVKITSLLDLFRKKNIFLFGNDGPAPDQEQKNLVKKVIALLLKK